jgi:predicted SAM-dependent methyltransferase
MLYLNLGCGSNRPQGEPWVNLDNLYDILPNPEQPERINLAMEANYLECNVSLGLPFVNGSVDAIVASHLLEHLSPLEGLKLLRSCYRVLREGGRIRVSIPDPDRFLKETLAGRTDWEEYCPEGVTFTEHALLHAIHKQILSEPALCVLFHLVGFSFWEKRSFKDSGAKYLADLDNRELQSLFMEAVK